MSYLDYCTVQNVRDETKKFGNENEVTDPMIESRISQAVKIIKVDLSGVMSEADLDAVAPTSNILNLLATYKATEKTLVTYYGYYRKVDEISDIQYYQKQYKMILQDILDGNVILTDASGSSPTAYPERTRKGSNLKLYPRKGVEGFIPDGAEDDYVDDGTLE